MKRIFQNAEPTDTSVSDKGAKVFYNIVYKRIRSRWTEVDGVLFLAKTHKDLPLLPDTM